MELSVISLLASLGVGGVLGIAIFFMYRQDRKYSEKHLRNIIERDQESREGLTKVLTELVTLLQRLNGRKSS